MKLGILAGGLALLFNAAGAAAQMYKWVDGKGVTHYSDTPPAGARAAAQPSVRAAPAVALPYALSRAVRSAPVTLYTMKQCKGCDEGRALLKERGIPFSEKTVSTAEGFPKKPSALRKTRPGCARRAAKTSCRYWWLGARS